MAAETTHWIYPVNPDSDYGILVDGEWVDVSVENLSRGIEEEQESDWALSTGYRLMEPGDWIWIYFTGGDRTIRALGQAVQIYERGGPGDWAVDIQWDRSATQLLMEDPIPFEAFGQRVQSVNRASPQTVRVLRKWLSRQGRSDVGDAPGVPADEEDARRRAIASVLRRQGQRPFRDDLLIAYKRKCAISGCGVEEALEAAHIKPYMGAHSNRTSNGLLLRGDLHSLFDLGLIGIDKDYRVVIAPSLKGSEYSAFDRKKIRLPQKKGDRPNRTALKRKGVRSD